MHIRQYEDILERVSLFSHALFHGYANLTHIWILIRYPMLDDKNITPNFG